MDGGFMAVRNKPQSRLQLVAATSSGRVAEQSVAVYVLPSGGQSYRGLKAEMQVGCCFAPIRHLLDASMLLVHAGIAERKPKAASRGMTAVLL